MTKGIGAKKDKCLINMSELVDAASIAQVHKDQLKANGKIKERDIKILRLNRQKKFNEESDEWMLLEFILFFLMIRRQPRSTLYPDTTLFRSDWD